jgi:hypothetical protein
VRQMPLRRAGRMGSLLATGRPSQPPQRVGRRPQRVGPSWGRPRRVGGRPHRVRGFEANTQRNQRWGRAVASCVSELENDRGTFWQGSARFEKTIDGLHCFCTYPGFCHRIAITSMQTRTFDRGGTDHSKFGDSTEMNVRPRCGCQPPNATFLVRTAFEDSDPLARPG